MLGGELAGLKPEVEEAAERDIEEISRAAGGIENADGGELVDPFA